MKKCLENWDEKWGDDIQDKIFLIAENEAKDKPTIRSMWEIAGDKKNMTEGITDMHQLACYAKSLYHHSCLFFSMKQKQNA